MPYHSAAGCGAWRSSWLLPRRKWALPRGLHAATRILGCFRAVAEVGGHRIDVALKPLLGVANDLAKPLEASLLLQPLELAMRVEDERRPCEPPRRPRTGGMKADDEER